MPHQNNYNQTKWKSLTMQSCTINADVSLDVDAAFVGAWMTE